MYGNYFRKIYDICGCCDLYGVRLFRDRKVRCDVLEFKEFEVTVMLDMVFGCCYALYLIARFVLFFRDGLE